MKTTVYARQQDPPALRCSRGQGIIEYAGALVMAAVIVSLAIVFPPNLLSGTFETIISTVTTMLSNHLPT